MNKIIFFTFRNNFRFCLSKLYLFVVFFWTSTVLCNVREYDMKKFNNIFNEIQKWGENETISRATTFQLPLEKYGRVGLGWNIQPFCSGYNTLLYSFSKSTKEVHNMHGAWTKKKSKSTCRRRIFRLNLPQTWTLGSTMDEKIPTTNYSTSLLEIMIFDSQHHEI